MPYRRRLIAFILLLLSLGLMGLAWRHRTIPPPLLLHPSQESRWVGVSAEQRLGIMSLLKDAFEVGSDRTILTEIPGNAPPASRMEVLQITATRRGDELCLQADRTSLNGGWQKLCTFGPPLQAYQDLLKALRQPLTKLENIVPASPSDFWELVDLLGPARQSALSQRTERAQALTVRRPDCAPAHLALAHLITRHLLVEPPVTSDPQTRCGISLSTALAIIPDYPRATYLSIRYKTDIGSPREALELSFKFRERHRRNFLAYGGLAYAARNAGLLEVALAALQEREVLCGGIVADPGVTENTYLYLSDMDRFQRTLASFPGTPSTPLREFYRGYLCLLRGDLPGAQRYFRATQEQPGRDVRFEPLAHIYDLALQGQREAALKCLRKLWADRASLYLPDGEFTFKIAEAFAFLGQREEAMDAATRAFGQGFGCTRWYRQSPLLAGLRDLPRWRNLLQHLQERQDLMALAYPLQRFNR